MLIGAISLVVGLATYGERAAAAHALVQSHTRSAFSSLCACKRLPHAGYNVTRSMGVRMAKLSPSRGFAAELATSLVILVASQ